MRRVLHDMTTDKEDADGNCDVAAADAAVADQATIVRRCAINYLSPSYE